METSSLEDRMTAQEVSERVAAIRAISNDDVEAHIAEYTLYLEVLRAIAEGRSVDARAIAQAALATQDIAFGRWSA